MEMNNRHLKPKPGSYFNVTANNLQSPMFKGSISFKQSQWFHNHHHNQATAAAQQSAATTTITTTAAATAPPLTGGGGTLQQQQQQQQATVHGTGNGTEDTRANIVAL